MPDLESATHYPGTVIFEATNLSVGRGTSVAFQVVGAPWLDASAVVTAMGELPGVDLRDTTVTPADPPDGKFGGQVVHAVRLRATNRTAYDPVVTAVALLIAVRDAHPEALVVNERSLALRIGTRELWNAAQAGETAWTLAGRWEAALGRFRAVREAYLLYP
jgi:beta-N-acetylhexosaminidase